MEKKKKKKKGKPTSSKIILVDFSSLHVWSYIVNFGIHCRPCYYLVHCYSSNIENHDNQQTIFPFAVLQESKSTTTTLFFPIIRVFLVFCFVGFLFAVFFGFCFRICLSSYAFAF